MILDFFFVVVVGIGHCRFVCSCQDGLFVGERNLFEWSIILSLNLLWLVMVLRSILNFYHRSLKWMLIFINLLCTCVSWRFKIVTAPPPHPHQFPLHQLLFIIMLQSFFSLEMSSVFLNSQDCFWEVNECGCLHCSLLLISLFRNWMRSCVAVLLQTHEYLWLDSVIHRLLLLKIMFA